MINSPVLYWEVHELILVSGPKYTERYIFFRASAHTMAKWTIYGNNPRIFFPQTLLIPSFKIVLKFNLRS
jgi:hypothetical protein